MDKLQFLVLISFYKCFQITECPWGLLTCSMKCHFPTSLNHSMCDIVLHIVVYLRHLIMSSYLVIYVRSNGECLLRRLPETF